MPTLRTGRLTPVLLGVLVILLTLIMAVANFLGFSDAVAFTLMESVGLVAAGAILLNEVFFEGVRRGIRTREFTVGDIMSIFAGLGSLIMGLGGIIGVLASTPVMGLPNWATGIVLLSLPLLLAREFFTK